MNVLEAVDTGRRIKRPNHVTWFGSNFVHATLWLMSMGAPDHLYDTTRITTEDIESEDWEVQGDYCGAV